MKKQDVLKLRKLSSNIGHFIRYWGFRKVHGEIWAVVYLSAVPLSGIEIGKVLNVSKALVSPALKELEAEGLIYQIMSENSKTKRYSAAEDVAEIIQGVLRRREIPMIEDIQQHYNELVAVGPNENDVNLERLRKMGGMIQLAQVGLTYLVESSQALGD